jgi:hypothetical protein
MPITSGLASSLEASDWNTAPEAARATPTRTPQATRGSRSSCTMKFSEGSPWPKMDGTTSTTGIG